jgi:hypothetical protein
MYSLLRIGVFVIGMHFLSLVSLGQVVINEVNADNPGGLDNQEFVELYGMPSASLDSLILVFYDGSNNSSYGSFDLTGYHTDSLGFFVIGSSLIPSAEIELTTSFIQNGCDAIAIYHGVLSDFPNGTLAHSQNLVDALVYSTDDLPITALVSALGLDVGNPLYQPFNETNQVSGSDLSQSRMPDGGSPFSVDDFALNLASPGWFNSPPCSAGYLSGPGNLGYYYVVQDSTPDYLAWSLSENPSSDSVLFALTDESGNFLTWLSDTFNYDSLALGIYHVVGLSYTGVLYDSIVGLPFTSAYSNICYDWTDNIINLEVLQHASILINEINADNPTGTDTGEFIELIATPNASLDNVVVVLYDGATGAVYQVYDLIGQVADSAGFFVIGSVQTENVDWMIDNSIIQNGCDAVALYIGHGNDFSLGQIAHSHYLLDAIVYVTDDAPSVNLIDALGLYTINPGYSPVNETVQSNGWDKGLSRVPDGGTPLDNANIVLQEITPGSPNIVLFGCWDSTACNYNPNANYNSGICLGPTDLCDDGDPNTINDMYDDSCNCSGTSVGIDEFGGLQSLLIYPNPASQFVFIKTPFSDPFHWEVFDTQGRRVLNGVATNEHLKINITGWDTGLYCVKVNNENQRISQTFLTE